MDNKTDYKAKIRKLLALAANNPSLEEAQAAMLRARQLMAKHKLTEEDCTEKMPEVTDRYTDWTATKMTDFWRVNLACVVAHHYCCEPVTQSAHAGKTYTIGFVGFPDDLDVCIEVFNYAVKFVNLRNEERRAELRSCHSPATTIRGLCNSYGVGFAHGAKEAYDRQERETQAGSVSEGSEAGAGAGGGDAESNRQSWGLIMAIPQEVTAYLNENTGKSTTWGGRYNAGSDAYQSGKEAGRSFVDTRALKGATA